MLIRYPGSKDRHADRIITALIINDRRLCEPFAGTAAITFECLRRRLIDQAWINDADRGISDLWTTIRDQPLPLIEMIKRYRPTADSFYQLRDAHLADPLDNSFATIVLHQISYSGLGRRAGSPIGGRNQTGKYLVGCRWNADRLAEGIREAHQLMSQSHVTITNVDWSDCPDWTWYVDPPYVAAGPDLYRQGVFSVRDLSNHLFAKTEWWVLSYDNAPEVQARFAWAHIDLGGETYLGTGRKSELLITPEPPKTRLF